jgi:capsular exopolysaccharide synthesis family protein
MPEEKPIHLPREKYPELIYPPTLTASTFNDRSDDDSVPLMDYWRVILSRRWTVAAILATVVALTMIYTFKQTPIYQATASIQIDKENPNILSFKDVYQIDSTTDDTLRTQFEVLKSRTLARRVIEDLKLNESDEFQPQREAIFGSFLDSIKNLHSFKNSAAKQSDRLRPLIDAYLDRLDVSPVRQARIVNISFESKDPELAARIINAHAKQFIDQNLQFKVEATEAASDFLEQNLVTLRQKLEKAEDQLQQYSQENQILFTEEGVNTATEKLRQLQEAYTKAQEDRIQKESYHRLVEGGHPDTLPQLIDNKLITDLTSKMADLQRQESELAVTFRPDYPLRRRLAGQISQLRDSIETEKARVVTMISSEYSASLQREQLLAAELEKQRDAVNKINEDIIQYNIYKGDADSVKELYDGLQKRLKEASVSAGLTASNIRIVDRAEVPTIPLRPRKALNLLFGIVTGLSFGVAFALFQEYLDSSIKAPEDVTRYLNLATLGMVPRRSSLPGKNGYANGDGQLSPYSAKSGVLDVDRIKPSDLELVVHESPSSLMAEAYRSIRTSLLLSASGRPPKTIVVTSAAPSEGKTTTAINLAISLTQTESKVALIDADMRKPRLQKVFPVPTSIGLSSFLAGASSLKDAIFPTSIPGLMVIPCGVTPPNPGELILSAGFLKMLEVLQCYFDYIVLDSPPVGNVSDARILAATADSTIVVVKAFSTSRYLARDAIVNLTNAHARVGGVVINDVDVRRRSYYSGYSYYRTYYSGYAAYAYGARSSKDSRTS